MFPLMLEWGTDATVGSQSAGTRGQHCGHPAGGGNGFLCDVKRFRAVDAAVVKHLLDGQPEGEGGDIQHVQQRGFTGAHLVSGLNQLHIAQHFSAAPGGHSGDARPKPGRRRSPRAPDQCSGPAL